MRGMNVVFAFVIAFAVMSGVFYGVWHFSMNKVVAKLPEVMSQTMPGKVKYAKVEKIFNPFHSKIKLIDSSVRMLDPKTGASVVVSLGDVMVITKLFSGKKFEVILPEDFKTVTTFQGRSHEYRTRLIDPVMEWVKNGEGYDLFFTVSGVLIKGRQNNYFANLVKLGYSYVTYDALNTQWSLVMNNLDLNRIKPFYRWPLVESVSLVLQSKGSQAFPMGYFLAASGAQDKNVFDSMVHNYLKSCSLFSQWNVVESRVVVDGVWYSYQGPLSINDELFVQLNGTLSSNKFATMMSGIKKVMGGFPLALERMLDKLGGDEERTQAITLSTNGPVLNVNGAPVGTMPTLPEQFNLHGRGERG